MTRQKLASLSAATLRNAPLDSPQRTLSPGTPFSAQSVCRRVGVLKTNRNCYTFLQLQGASLQLAQISWTRPVNKFLSPQEVRARYQATVTKSDKMTPLQEPKFDR
ncbi:hypothetical protein PHYPSEUDO_008202 [Phytophthora pseudosyringae]|uniref:Uncharacterized protein n=1 Tax=Phytophthora pseudosyringae TaxID=221518 RepID=A0A8T1WDL6_9STRA|nr:hypothetical protein PHYPSEUDO_008202 [Phytophthora pseudosyringae]